MLIIAPMVNCQRANDNDNAYNYRAMWFRANTAAKFWSSFTIVRERQMISSERIYERTYILPSISHSNQTQVYTRLLNDLFRTNQQIHAFRCA